MVMSTRTGRTVIFQDSSPLGLHPTEVPLLAAMCKAVQPSLFLLFLGSKLTVLAPEIEPPDEDSYDPLVMTNIAVSLPEGIIC